MKPHSFLYCDILDLMYTAAKLGSPDVVFKVDHCYYFVHNFMPNIFRSLGFEVLSANHGFIVNHVGYLLRRTEPEALAPVPRSSIYAAVGKLHEMSINWRTSVTKPSGILNRVRRTLYRVRGRISFPSLSSRS